MSKDSGFQNLTRKDYCYIAKEIGKKYFLFFIIAFTFALVASIYLWMQVDKEVEVDKEVIEQVGKKVDKEVIEFGVKLIAEKTTQLSILMLGIAFFYLLLNALAVKIWQQKKREEKGEVLNADDIEEEPRKKKNDFAGALTRLLIGSFGASTIPTGISLVLCAFKGGEYLSYLSGLEIYIAFAGITLMSIAVLSIYEEKSRMEDEIISNLDQVLSTID
jgi:hypothetical protein